MAKPQLAGAKITEITCPYCLAGYAEVVVMHRHGQVQIEGIKDPRKCNQCQRYFRLKPRVVLEGVKLEEGG